ncbi:uncharacterized protein V2V93DRAFT_164758 [Kockiozyma suomiensis]|uniref:uncharacterized protein n=1 Tax=Kockiozyma suomiensis TaxID=1337062 RepID=UPI0033434AEF
MADNYQRPLWSRLRSLFMADRSHFALFSPLSAGALLSSFFSKSSFLLSPFTSFLSFFSKSKPSSADVESLPAAKSFVVEPRDTSSDTQLFPQIILDVRLTAAPSELATATPCATDPSATLLQVHNAGGELVGFDLADAAMQQQSSSYMFQLQPQLQYQLQYPPQFVAPPQVLAAPPESTDPGEFLNKLDELEVYIAQMRSRLSGSGSTPSGTPAPEDHHLTAAAAASSRVVRRRNERQSMSSAAPYVRPAVYQPSTSSAAFVAPEDLSSSASWSPADFADDSSPSSVSADDASYSFTPAMHDPVDQFTNPNEFVDLHGKDILDDQFQSLGMMSQQPFQTVAALTSPGYPNIPEFMFEDQSDMFIHSQHLHAPNAHTHMPSPASSMSSPQTSTGSSSAANSPASSNSSPSSSPPKTHAGLSTPSSSGVSGTEASSPMLLNSSSQPTFQCPHCPSKFRIKGYLTRHLKKHAMNKAYTCPFYDPTSTTPCHSTGGFSRRDTYKTHLKSRHFVYPAGTRSDQRAGIRGWCAACGMLFACNENWVENHVEGGECRDFHSESMYA